jgi:hypothetical protein
VVIVSRLCYQRRGLCLLLPQIGEVERRHHGAVVRRWLVFGNDLVVHEDCCRQRRVQPVTAIAKAAGVSDRRPQIFEVCPDVCEPGFLEREGGRAVQCAASLCPVDTVERRLRVGS